MATGQVSPLLQYLHRIIGHAAPADQSDGQLLGRFVYGNEQDAFTALVHRHGPMVLGVCRRVLHDEHAAEDVFQATFLVLVRKARALRQYPSLGSWLHTVAHRLALRTHSRNVRMRAVEQPGVAMPEPAVNNANAWPELRPVLDAELDRLPDKYRAPVVLCYLEGRTNEEAARELGWPTGTVKVRLARARDLLKARLTRRGLTLAAALLTPRLAPEVSAAVPAALVATTTEAATLFAAGSVGAAGTVAARAVPIAQGALHAMSMSHLRSIAVLLFTLGLLGTGAGVLLSFGSGTTTEAAGAPSAPAMLPAGVPAEDTRRATPAGTVDKERRDVPIAPAVNQRRALQQKLGLAINLDKGIDPNTTLKDALELLADRYDLTMIIDIKAFEAAGIPDVEERLVSLPKMVGVNLGTALRMLLAHVRGPQHQAAYAVRKDHIAIITTAQLFPTEQMTREERGWLPTVSADFDRTPLEAALREVSDQTGINVILDVQLGDKGRTPVTARMAGVPVDTAVRVLANMAGLQTVALDNVLYVTGIDNAKQLRAEQDRREAKQREVEKAAREARQREAGKDAAKPDAQKEKGEPSTKPAPDR